MGWYFKSLIPFQLNIFVNVAAGSKLNGVKDKKIKTKLSFFNNHYTK